MKIRMPAKKLANADVHYLSLVERGANRTPFKIQKQENKSMINFGWKREEEQAPQAKIVAYVIKEHDRDESFELAMARAGAKVDSVYEDGEVVLYRQDETALKSEDEGEVNPELVSIKLSPDFAVVLKGYDPYAMAGETSFTDNLKSQGFMPGFSMAAQALTASINNTMTAAKNSKEAAAKVNEALAEFGDFVTSLAAEIPQAAFKAEAAFRAAKEEMLKLAGALSEEETAHAATLEAADRMKFYQASPEDRAKMMGAKAKPVAAAPAVAVEAEKTQKGANNTSADSGKGEGSQNMSATSAVNNGPAGKATSEGFDARRVDGQGGEPSAVANMSVSSDAAPTAEADRGGNSGSPVQTNEGKGLANNGVGKEEVAKMINDGFAASSRANAEMVAKALADALAPVSAQIAAIAKGVEEAKSTAKQALEAATKTGVTSKAALEAAQKNEATAKAALELAQKTGNIVVGGDSGGDQAPAAPVVKTESGMGTFDTAYHQHIRKDAKERPAPRRISSRLVA